MDPNELKKPDFDFAERFAALPEAQRQLVKTINTIVTKFEKTRRLPFNFALIGTLVGCIVGGIISSATAEPYRGSEYAFAILFPWIVLAEFGRNAPFLFFGGLIGFLAPFLIIHTTYTNKKQAWAVAYLCELKKTDGDNAREAIRWLAENDKSAKYVLTKYLSAALI